MRLNEHNWNNKINFRQNASFRQIRDAYRKYLKANPDEYINQLQLKSHAIEMALKEAFDTQVRTYEASFVRIKERLNQRYWKYFKDKLISHQELNFIQHVINHAFYNCFQFFTFEQDVLKKYNFISAFANYLTKIKKLVKLKPEDQKKNNLILSFLFYVRKLVKRYIYSTNVTDVVGQINPTISLDATLYDFKFDETTQKYQLHISGLQTHSNRFYFELSGFKNGFPLKSLKKNQFGNLTVSYNSTTNQFFVHLLFKKLKKKIGSLSLNKNFSFIKHINKQLTQQEYENKFVKKPIVFNKYIPIENQTNIQISPFYQYLIEKYVKENKIEFKKLLSQAIGFDYGYHESGTTNHDKKIGEKQHEILKKESVKQQEFLVNVQQSNKKINCFGMEKKNSGRRNNQNNFFNHNAILNNININYRKNIYRSSARLDSFTHQIVNEMLDYCVFNNIKYICLEELNFKGQKTKGKRFKRFKKFNSQINLMQTGKFYELLQQKIDQLNLNIQLLFINPAYTSQMCSSCGSIHQENRIASKNAFCCRNCHFGDKLDVGLYTQIDDFNASINIRNLAMLKAFSEEFSILFRYANRKNIHSVFLQLADDFKNHKSFSQ